MGAAPVSAKDRAIAVVLAVAIGVIGMIGFGLLPVRAAGRLRCDAPLRGAHPKEKATEGYLVGREEQACKNKSGSRMTTILIAGVLFISFGVSAVVLPESNFERVAFGGEDPEDVYEAN